ncbi:MAG: preprotein translocase subunit SecG [Clostridiales bacterium]|jgi:preprotein translocase subunit SecG|nr:preprotein translocase subunit SecG [Clostridiales bacterium]
MSAILYAARIIPAWVTNSFPIIRVILIVVMVITAVALTVVVLAQPSNSEGMGALGGQSADTFYEKNKGRSVEGVMKRLTIVFGIIMALISVLFFVTLVIYPVGL